MLMQAARRDICARVRVITSAALLDAAACRHAAIISLRHATLLPIFSADVDVDLLRCADDAIMRRVPLRLRCFTLR